MNNSIKKIVIATWLIAFVVYVATNELIQATDNTLAEWTVKLNHNATNSVVIADAVLSTDTNKVLTASSITFTNGWSLSCTSTSMVFVAP